MLPPATLLAVSQAKPVYNSRYVVFCIPALALLAGLGLARLRPFWRAGAASLILALAIPAQLSMRVPVTGMREAVGFLSSREQPGDAIVYPGTGIPPGISPTWRLRAAPRHRNGPLPGGLRPSVRRERPGTVAQRARAAYPADLGPADRYWQNPAKYLSTDFRLLHTWRLDHGDLRIWLYERETLTLRDVDPVHGHHPSYGGLL